MKKILLSLAVIGIVSAVVVGGTSAWFSDTEEITNNTFSTGSIDINVDKGEAQQIGHFVFEDMKPGQTENMEFTINNTGANSANIWKKINVTTDYKDEENLADKPITEPECVEGKGVWDSSSNACDINTASGEGPYAPKYDLENYIKYDLSVKVYAPNGTDPIWWQTIYVDGDDKVINDVYGTSATPIYDPDKGVILGMIPAGGKMEVKQSYHLDGETVTNWAQRDTMTFDVVVYAEQLQNSVVLVSKKGDGTSQIDQSQLPTKYAELDYKVKDNEFNYTLNVYGMPDDYYTLINYVDPARVNSLALANVTVSGNTASLTGSINLNKDLENAKIWLIPGTYTPGSLTGDVPWAPTKTLFETALIDYYDTSTP